MAHARSVGYVQHGTVLVDVAHHRLDRPQACGAPCGSPETEAIALQQAVADPGSRRDLLVGGRIVEQCPPGAGLRLERQERIDLRLQYAEKVVLYRLRHRCQIEQVENAGGDPGIAARPSGSCEIMPPVECPSMEPE